MLNIENKLERNNRMINIAIIDQQIARQGRFCLIDWLLEENLLDYADYENWRNAQIETLDDKFHLDKKSIKELLLQTDKHCKNLGLVSELQSFHCWGEKNTQLLSVTHNSGENEQLTRRWLRPQDLPQLDLFMDNSAQLAEHELLDALTERRFESAQKLLQVYAKLNSECPRLGGYQDLINYAMHISACPKLSADEIEDEWDGLNNEVTALAKEVLGALSRDYLAFAWRRLAINMAGIEFDGEKPELHISSALLQIPDYSQAIQVLNGDKALYTQPVLLLRLIQSYSKVHQYEHALINWCHLIELDSQLAESALDDCKDEQVRSLWSDFWEIKDDWSCELFPAYVFLKKPELLHLMQEFPELKNEATTAMKNLMLARLNADNEISARKNMKAINGFLLTLYLKSTN